MNIADLLTLPKTVKEELYAQFYSAQLRAEETGKRELRKSYQQYLHELKELWQLSPAEIVLLETRVAERRAYAKEVFHTLSELEKDSKETEIAS